MAAYPAQALTSLIPVRWAGHANSITNKFIPVHGSKTSHIYCSFHVGEKLSIIVLVRTNLFPCFATQNAFVDPRQSRVFIGDNPFALIIPSSKIQLLGFHISFVVGLKSPLEFVYSSNT
ncbi:hypothetical protein Hanom_Chr08g00735361 [Helianthus anomalus]